MLNYADRIADNNNPVPLDPSPQDRIVVVANAMRNTAVDDLKLSDGTGCCCCCCCRRLLYCCFCLLFYIDDDDVVGFVLLLFFKYFYNNYWYYHRLFTVIVFIEFLIY